MSEVKAEKKSRAMAQVPAAERRAALLKLLVKLGATTATTAAGLGKLASKLGYTEYDVYCLVYHKHLLATSEFVKTVKLEDSGLSAYITAKGVKSLASGDPKKGPKPKAQKVPEKE